MKDSKLFTANELSERLDKMELPMENNIADAEFLREIYDDAVRIEEMLLR